MTDPLKLLSTYSRAGVVIDTNLLLLFVLGSYSRKQIGANRLATFAQSDFELIVKLIDHFKFIVTTPNILTEVSNLSNAVPERERRAYFASFADRVALLEEQHVTCSVALTNRWARFGLTDAAIAEIAKNRYLVLTDDFRLS